jgi:hypothetical protein
MSSVEQFNDSTPGAAAEEGAALALLVHGPFGFQSARCRIRALFFMAFCLGPKLETCEKTFLTLVQGSLRDRKVLLPTGNIE